MEWASVLAGLLKACPVCTLPQISHNDVEHTCYHGVRKDEQGNADPSTSQPCNTSVHPACWVWHGAGCRSLDIIICQCPPYLWLTVLKVNTAKWKWNVTRNRRHAPNLQLLQRDWRVLEGERISNKGAMQCCLSRLQKAYCNDLIHFKINQDIYSLQWALTATRLGMTKQSFNNVQRLLVN